MTTDRNKPQVVSQLIETLSTGGAENLVVQIANGLAAQGYSSHIYVLFGPGPLSDRVDSRVKVRYFHHQRSSVRSPRFLPSIISGYGMLRDALREDNISVIQSHLPGANFWGLLLSLRGLCAVVPTVHNNREFDYGDADNPLRSRLRRMAYHAMLKHCPAMIAVSEQSRISLLKEVGASASLANKLFAVPNGVLIPDAISPETRQGIRKVYDCDDNTLLILAAGRHSRQKNFGLLLDAMSQSSENLPPWRMIIAGEGPQKEELIAQASALGLTEQVLFPGVVGNLDKLMLAADAFIMPSLWEGLPLVLLEAMAAQLPVIGTRIDGISEVITHDKTGILVEPDNASALAIAMGNLMQSAKDRQRIAASALSLVKEKYALETVLQKLINIYDVSVERVK